MLLLSQVDEPTFNELSKRLHQKMKKDHGLQMPLSKLREVLIQAVGHKSLHDARKSWAASSPPKEQTGPQNAGLTHVMESFPDHLQPFKNVWEHPPQPWLEAIEAIEKGTLMDWAREHPGVLKSLAWRRQNLGHRYVPVTIVDLLLEGGEKERGFLMKLSETNEISIAREQWETFIKTQQFKRGEQTPQNIEFLKWAAAKTVEHSKQWIEAFESYLRRQPDPSQLWVFQLIAQEIQALRPDFFTTANLNSSNRVLLFPEDIVGAWKKELETLRAHSESRYGLDENLISNTLLAKKMSQVLAWMELHHPSVVWLLLVETITITIATRASLDYLPLLEKLLPMSPPEEICAPNAYYSSVSLPLSKMMLSLLKNGDTDSFVRAINSNVFGTPTHKERTQKEMTKGSGALLACQTSEESESQILDFLLPTLTKARETQSLPPPEHPRPHLSQEEKEKSAIALGMAGHIRSILGNRNTNQSPSKETIRKITAVINRGLNPTARQYLASHQNMEQTFFGDVLLHSRFSLAWAQAFDQLGVPWADPIVALPAPPNHKQPQDTYWLPPLVAGLLTGNISPFESLEPWYELGCPPLAGSPDLPSVIKRVFRQTSDHAVLNLFVSMHGLEKRPVWSEVWQCVQTSDQAAWLFEKTNTLPNALDLAHAAYNLNTRESYSSTPEMIREKDRVSTFGQLLKYAIKMGVDVIQPFSERGETLLHWVGHIQPAGYPPQDPVIPLLKMLIEAGCNPLSRTTDNFKPQDWAYPDRHHYAYYQDRLAFLQKAEMDWAMKTGSKTTRHS